MAKGEKAQRILMVDSHPLNCIRKTLGLAQLTKTVHLGLNDIGLRERQLSRY